MCLVQRVLGNVQIRLMRLYAQRLVFLLLFFFPQKKSRPRIPWDTLGYPGIPHPTYNENNGVQNCELDEEYF